MTGSWSRSVQECVTHFETAWEADGHAGVHLAIPSGHLGTLLLETLVLSLSKTRPSSSEFWFRSGHWQVRANGGIGTKYKASVHEVEPCLYTTRLMATIRSTMRYR